MNAFTRRTCALERMLLALLFLLPAGTALAGDDGDNQAILPALKTNTTLASTIPANGDLNPYGVAQVKRTTGNLRAGHVLVSNFNDKGNFQGARRLLTLGPMARVSSLISIPRHSPGAVRVAWA